MLSLLLLPLLGFATAQSTSTSTPLASTTNSATVASGSSGCGEQIDITIQTCLTQLTAQLNDCAPNDWDCLCTQQSNVLTCYNNCLTDPNRYAAEQQNTAWCNAAKAYPSTSTSSHGTATATVAVSSGDATASGTTTASQTLYSGLGSGSTSSATAASTTSGSGAAATVIPAGMAAVAGLLALL